ncbi:MAG: hypothetical protein LBP76_02345 [Treponema sp.]|nr:hypothetical protein [Treponema sp.]
MKSWYGILLLFFFLNLEVRGESFRALVAGNLEISLNNPEGVSLPIFYNNSVIISLGADLRFLRGIEIDLTAPQIWLPYRGSLAMVIYTNLDGIPRTGIADIEGRQIIFEPLPGKIQNIYQIPLLPSHGLRSGPYSNVTVQVSPSSFPLLFRLMPISKGLSEDLESMRFQLSVKPILSNEGAVRIRLHYPENLHGKPFTLLIDDTVIDKPSEELLLKEGEHSLIVLSEAYRNESRRFLVERAKSTELIIELKDPTPLMSFEAPENAGVFLDNLPITNIHSPRAVEPGRHEVKFQISDYMIIKNIVVEKGKTYRVALSIDINIWENE